MRKTLYKACRGEYTEKKSRFIADICYIESEEDASAHLQRIRREFYDARHHCSAFIISGKDGAMPLMRSSDDGEPQGTAGHPMLDVLSGAGIENISAVVTRYFGGTLLGTGGLVRSYTKALQDALDKSEIIERRIGIPLSFTTDYNMAGKLEYYFGKNSIPILSKDYSENVSFTILSDPDSLSRIEKDLLESSGGLIIPEKKAPLEYAAVSGSILTF